MPTDFYKLLLGLVESESSESKREGERIQAAQSCPSCTIKHDIDLSALLSRITDSEEEEEEEEEEEFT